ncbi:MAG: 2-C-methyl-D-erythritol 2,4-cyclodiphosphate synthase [bacterium]
MKSTLPYRIGIGFDAHVLKRGGKLRLGGVDFPVFYRLIGHSDADVLVHSLIDALLGAMAMPDIGTMFPDTQPEYKDANSIELLQIVVRLIKSSGWRVAQTDSTLVTDIPHIAPFIASIRENLATTLKIAPEYVGLKAKTTEGTRVALVRKSIAAISITMLVPNK